MDATTVSTQYVLVIPRNSFLRLDLVIVAKVSTINHKSEEKIIMKVKGDKIREHNITYTKKIISSWPI